MDENRENGAFTSAQFLQKNCADRRAREVSAGDHREEVRTVWSESQIVTQHDVEWRPGLSKTASAVSMGPGWHVAGPVVVQRCGNRGLKGCSSVVIDQEPLMAGLSDACRIVHTPTGGCLKSVAGSATWRVECYRPRWQEPLASWSWV